MTVPHIGVLNLTHGVRNPFPVMWFQMRSPHCIHVIRVGEFQFGHSWAKDPNDRDQRAMDL